MMKKINIKKLAVFDLDDTLYLGNSHNEILCEYYRTKLFKGLLLKIFFKLLPNIAIKINNYLYSKIPENIKKIFILPFNNDVLRLLEQKRKQKYYILIVSNAPIELIENAAKILNVNYLYAPPYKKEKVLLKLYSYEKLFVCTDNKSDIALLKIADEAMIVCKNKNKKFFVDSLKNKNYKFLGD